MFGGEKLSSASNILGLQLGGEELKIGPSTNINLMLILLNRAFLFYQHTINWAHGRRDYTTTLPVSADNGNTEIFTSNWSTEQLRICKAYFKAVTEKHEDQILESGNKLTTLITKTLAEISRHE